MKIYEMASELRQAMDILAGSDLDETTIADTIEGLCFSLKEKLLSLVAYSEELKAQAEAIRLAEKRMEKRRSALLRKVSEIKEYALYIMRSCDIDCVKNDQLSVSVANNPGRVVVHDLNDLDDDYKKKIVSADKQKIKLAIESGLKIKSAELVKDKRLKIS